MLSVAEQITYAYDGTHRRITRTIQRNDALDITSHFYHDGRSVIETRNGSDELRSQQVWDNLAGHYVDSLLEISHDINGSGEVDRRFYALTDTLYNVMAIVDTYGNMAERYEYTPYGNRSVFRSSDFIVSNADFDGDGDVDIADQQTLSSNYGTGTGMTFADGDTDGDGDVDIEDLQTLSNAYTGSITWPDAQTPVTPADASLQLHTGVNLCDFGFQGKMHDDSVGVSYWNARYWHPTMGRFITTDPHPSIYPDGQNRYAGYHIMRGGVDPTGLDLIDVYRSSGRSVSGIQIQETGGGWFTDPTPMPNTKSIRKIGDIVIENGREYVRLADGRTVSLSELQTIGRRSETWGEFNSDVSTSIVDQIGNAGTLAVDVAGGYFEGVGQGIVNNANAVTDIGVDAVNLLVIVPHNAGVAANEYMWGVLDSVTSGPARIPYDNRPGWLGTWEPIEWEWSEGRVIKEDPSERWWSRTCGEAGVFLATIAWSAHSAASKAATAPSRVVAPAKRMTGETVLGRYPDYVKLSEKLGARRFEVPMEHWNRMTKAEQWAANQKFLDRTILRGDTIRLASPPSAAKPGTWFHRELQYLYERGYKLDGMKLVPGGAQ